MLIDDPAVLAAAKKLQSLQAQLQKSSLRQVRATFMVRRASGSVRHVSASTKCRLCTGLELVGWDGVKRLFSGNARKAAVFDSPSATPCWVTCTGWSRQAWAPAAGPYVLSVTCPVK